MAEIAPPRPKMAKITETVVSIKKWASSKRNIMKQSVLEKFGKAEKTTDADLDKRISKLNDLQSRYREVLIAATAYSIHFDALKSSQKYLIESFKQLSLREAGLKEQLDGQNEMMRQFTQAADEFSKQLEYFASSMETLCTKTISDTLKTIQGYENARFKFDAYRHELASMQRNSDVAQTSIVALQDKVDTLKLKYEQLKEDVRVKLSLLDENRLSVMKDQLAKFEEGLRQYFTGNLAALTQVTQGLTKKDEETTDSVVKDEEANYSASLLEE